jgi:hypothetical protein
MSDLYIVKIDQLPEEKIAASDVRGAARKVAALIAERPALHALPDDEPVQIKRPDRTPWGRHLTLGDFRHGDVASEGDEAEGPQRPATPSA